MYLIDTSVWIAYFRGHNHRASEYFNHILDDQLPFGITPVIYQEILQGAASQKDFDKLKLYLSTMRFFYPEDPIVAHQEAAHIFLKCRSKGCTIRSTIDCFIAHTAIAHQLILVHHDQDYQRIQTVFPELRNYDTP